jgi:hypothetical protein
LIGIRVIAAIAPGVTPAITTTTTTTTITSTPTPVLVIKINPRNSKSRKICRFQH